MELFRSSAEARADSEGVYGVSPSTAGQLGTGDAWMNGGSMLDFLNYGVHIDIPTSGVLYLKRIWD